MKAQGSHKQVKKAARSVSQRGLGAAGREWKEEMRQQALAKKKQKEKKQKKQNKK